MASFFKLILDTLAPSGLTLLLNNGATYATSNTVTASIAVEDATTTGYQMKIWGTKAAETEETASWETFAASKSLVLPAGDGLKTVHIKVRDDVGNESAAVTASITVNTAVPVVTITGPDKSKISKVTGFDVCAFSFTSDVDFEEYTVRVVPSESSLNTAGTQIPVTGGSTNTSGTTGGYKKNTAINVTINGADLETASSGDGTKIVKVFVKNAAGTWSVA
jgi:hypothetical protein|nr:MAG TPA: hypothetical protein [Caudoviricetes sp.]